MKKKILRFFDKHLNIHNYNVPIVSIYVSFNVRTIIYECACGKRKAYTIKFPEHEMFPIETSMHYKRTDIEDILNHKINPIL